MPPVSKTKVRREVKELLLLFEVSQTLDSSMESSGREPRSRAQAHGRAYGNDAQHDHSSQPRDRRAFHRIRVWPFELPKKTGGVTSKAKGSPAKWCRLDGPLSCRGFREDPRFLDRTGARQGLKKSEVSFICVPIKLGKEVVGALSVDRLFVDSRCSRGGCAVFLPLLLPWWPRLFAFARKCARSERS